MGCPEERQGRFTRDPAQDFLAPIHQSPFRNMTRLPPRPALAAIAAATAVWLTPAASLAAQQTFDLPPASPTPTPAPAGPADERAGVIIPPRAVPEATATPEIQPLPSPGTSQPPLRLPATVRTAPARAPAAAPTTGTAPAPTATIAPAPLPDQSGAPIAVPSGAPVTLPTLAAPEGEFTDTIVAMPTWQLVAISGGMGALGLPGAGLLLRRRRKPKALRLAEHAAGSPAGDPTASEPPRLDLTLEITGATRSLMMFTLEYRLVIANRSARAVNDVRVAAQLACARASGGAQPSAGTAQDLADVERVGPHQARSVSGTVQIPLSAITPLRQGQTPLFIPLVHVTLDAEGLPPLVQRFVIGTPSTLGGTPSGTSGRLYPISLGTPPAGSQGWWRKQSRCHRVPPLPDAAGFAASHSAR